MIDRHQQLWINLIDLVDTNEAFYYKDFYNEQYDRWFRIFNYRLASYTDWLSADALECRGVMFEVDGEGEHASPIRLAAWPPEKFFNLNENPLSIGVDLSNPKQVMLKMDGSLISSYYIENVTGVSCTLHLKSKGAIASDQALAAMTFLNLPQNSGLKQDIYDMTCNHECTVNMEYTAPNNRIVVGYMEPNLTILSIRYMLDGSYVDKDARSVKKYPHLCKHWVNILDDYGNPEEFVRNIPQMTDIEGYVIQLASQQIIKVKTEWYLTQHRAKDSINSPRRLFEAVLEQCTDDLRSLFFDDPLVIQRITEMEQTVDTIYNHLIDTVERFHARNKHLERKEYAILGQRELIKSHFGLAMTLYLGKEVDYKSFLIKHYKDYNIQDTPDLEV